MDIITIPEGVTLIASNLFKGNRNLVSITFPDSLKTIDNYAFENCTNLKTIKFDENLETLEKGAFYDCISIESIELPDTLKKIAVGLNRNDLGEFFTINHLSTKPFLQAIDYSIYCRDEEGYSGDSGEEQRTIWSSRKNGDKLNYPTNSNSSESNL